MFLYACCCKIQCCRFFLHLLWIILFLLTAIIFLVALVFGVVSIVGKDGVAVFDYIFSDENLKAAKPAVIGYAGTAGTYLSVCLNGKNNLEFKFNH